MSWAPKHSPEEEVREREKEGGLSSFLFSFLLALNSPVFHFQTLLFKDILKNKSRPGESNGGGNDVIDVHFWQHRAHHIFTKENQTHALQGMTDWVSPL